MSGRTDEAKHGRKTAMQSDVVRRSLVRGPPVPLMPDGRMLHANGPILSEIAHVTQALGCFLVEFDVFRCRRLGHCIVDFPPRVRLREPGRTILPVTRHEPGVDIPNPPAVEYLSALGCSCLKTQIDDRSLEFRSLGEHVASIAVPEALYGALESPRCVADGL